MYRLLALVALLCGVALLPTRSYADPVVAYFNDLSGFNTAAGSPAFTIIDFDSIVAGTDITGTTISGVKFLGPGSPLIVVTGASTFTPTDQGYGGIIDASTNKLFPTSGANVLSPGGSTLGPGPNPAVEEDDLTLVFGSPVSAFGFDILFQSLDCCSYVSLTVLDPSNAVLYSNEFIPTGIDGGGGNPGGSVFVGLVSNQADIARIVVDEFDDDNVYPDNNIGYDTFRFAPTAAPSVNVQGTVNSASFAAGTNPLAAGSIAAVFGTNLNDGSSNPSSSFGSDGKLLTTLGGAGVTFNGIAASLFSSYPNQLHLQIPMELAGATSASIRVTVGGQTSALRTVPLGSVSPGIFTINNQGTGQGAIQVANTTIFAAPQGSIAGAQARPANPGETITIYCTGLGAVTNAPATGKAASNNPLSTTIATPQVTIGGIPATVTSAGLAPGFVGLYQVNAQVPTASPTDNTVPVALTVGGVQSNTVTIAVAGS